MCDTTETKFLDFRINSKSLGLRLIQRPLVFDNSNSCNLSKSSKTLEFNLNSKVLYVSTKSKFLELIDKMKMLKQSGKFESLEL